MQSLPSVIPEFEYKLVIKNKQIPEYKSSAKYMPIFCDIIKNKSCSLKLVDLNEDEEEEE